MQNEFRVMKSHPRTAMACAVLLLAVVLPRAQGQSGPTNFPPQISILWPRADDSIQFRFFTCCVRIKIKAEASDPDGSIAQVQFFAADDFFGKRLIGAVTNPPFNLVWSSDLVSTVDLTTVAVDNLGARTESAPARVFFGETGPDSAVEILSPGLGTLFAAPATFLFSGEVMAGYGVLGPVEFFVGTNSVGIVDQGGFLTATTPPVSVMVSNLAEGQYDLTVRLRDTNSYCTCLFRTNTIQVVKLGIRPPTITTNGGLQFEVVTSFPRQPNLVQTSTNLVDWVSISTNVPAGNSFIFTEPLDAIAARRFYRAWVPP